MIVHSDELIRLLSQFFILSPYSFCINDAILLESIQDGTYDPVVVSLMIVYVISRDPAFVDPPLSPPHTNPNPLSPANDRTFRSLKTFSSSASTSTFDRNIDGSTSIYTFPPHPSAATVDPSLLTQSLGQGPAPPNSARSSFNIQAAIEPYMTFVEQTICTRLAETGATSISTIQGLLLLGTHYFQAMQLRRAWAIVSTGLVCVRENLGRRRSERSQRDEARRANGGVGGERIRNDKELVEDEQSVNIWWVLGELFSFDPIWNNM